MKKICIILLTSCMLAQAAHASDATRITDKLSRRQIRKQLAGKLPEEKIDYLTALSKDDRYCQDTDFIQRQIKGINYSQGKDTQDEDMVLVPSMILDKQAQDSRNQALQAAAEMQSNIEQTKQQLSIKNKQLAKATAQMDTCKTNTAATTLSINVNDQALIAHHKIIAALLAAQCVSKVQARQAEQFLAKTMQAWAITNSERNRLEKQLKICTYATQAVDERITQIQGSITHAQNRLHLLQGELGQAHMQPEAADSTTLAVTAPITPAAASTGGQHSNSWIPGFLRFGS